jgi:hypothetical protein
VRDKYVNLVVTPHGFNIMKILEMLVGMRRAIMRPREYCTLMSKLELTLDWDNPLTNLEGRGDLTRKGSISNWESFENASDDVPYR